MARSGLSDTRRRWRCRKAPQSAEAWILRWSQEIKVEWRLHRARQATTECLYRKLHWSITQSGTVVPGEIWSDEGVEGFLRKPESLQALVLVEPRST